MHRLATAEDLAAVFAIYMHEQVIPYLGFDPMPMSDFSRLFQELLDSQSFFVYEVNQQLLGFYKTTRYPGRAQHVCMLGTLAIHPDHHGNGLATQIITDLINRLRNEGIKRLELYVEADNPRAIRFYQRLGFEKEATLKKFYKRSHQDHYTDEYIMSRLFD